MEKGSVFQSSCNGANEDYRSLSTHGTTSKFITTLKFRKRGPVSGDYVNKIMYSRRSRIPKWFPPLLLALTHSAHSTFSQLICNLQLSGGLSSDLQLVHGF